MCPFQTSWPSYSTKLGGPAGETSAGGRLYWCWFRRVSSCNLDIHWVPMISRCGYCDLQYSAIARLGKDRETLHCNPSVASCRKSVWRSEPDRSDGRTGVLSCPHSFSLLTLELHISFSPVLLPGSESFQSRRTSNWHHFFRFLQETLRNCTNFIRLTLTYFSIRLTCIWMLPKNISKASDVFSCQFNFKPWQIPNINIWHEQVRFYITPDSIYIYNVCSNHRHQTLS